MRKLITIEFVFLAGFAINTLCQDVKRVFLLENAKNKQWCAYVNEQAWKSQVAALSAPVVGTVEFSDGKISQISVTEEDETGDWVVYDRYHFANNGLIRDLDRTINVLPGDLSRVEEYAFDGGKAKKLSSKDYRLSTKQELQQTKDEDEEWTPKLTIRMRIKDFPFSPLLVGKQSESCIPVKTDSGN